MRILAFSDIHNKINCVEQLVKDAQGKCFDAIVIAGDIGSENAEKFFTTLKMLGKPVFYIYGNWDSKLSYDALLCDDAIHLHNNLITFNGYHFIGFSGCPTHWGLNPEFIKLQKQLEKTHQKTLTRRSDLKSKRNIDTPEGKKAFATLKRFEQTKEYKDYLSAHKAGVSDVLDTNKKMIIDTLISQGVDLRKVVIVTHEKFAHLHKYFPSAPLLHLFGHIHTFKHNIQKDTHCINVAALDIFQNTYVNDDLDIIQPSNFGNYCFIDIDDDGVTSKKVKLLEANPVIHSH